MGNIESALSTFIESVQAYDTECSEAAAAEVLLSVKDLLGPFPSIDLLNKIVSSVKAEREKILNDDIPAILHEHNLKKAIMSDGTEVSLDVAYNVKTVDKTALALWLEENGMGSIIKDTFEFEKGSVDQAIIEFLGENGYSYTRDSFIHGMSLKSAIKKHLEAGGDKPDEAAATVSVFELAKVKPPKGGF